MPVAGLERKTNPQLVELILELRKVAATTEAPIWADIADRLTGSSKNWAQVNVEKLGSVLNEGEIALVPGKVLSTGEAKKGLKVAAFSFSEFAREKIEKSGGKCLSIHDALKIAPKGKGVRIIA